MYTIRTMMTMINTADKMPKTYNSVWPVPASTTGLGSLTVDESTGFNVEVISFPLPVVFTSVGGEFVDFPPDDDVPVLIGGSVPDGIDGKTISIKLDDSLGGFPLSLTRTIKSYRSWVKLPGEPDIVSSPR